MGNFHVSYSHWLYLVLKATLPTKLIHFHCRWIVTPGPNGQFHWHRQLAYSWTFYDDPLWPWKLFSLYLLKSGYIHFESQMPSNTRIIEFEIFRHAQNHHDRKFQKLHDTAKGGLTMFWELFTTIPLRSQAFKLLITSLSEDIWESNWNWGLFKDRRSYLMIFGLKY